MYFRKPFMVLVVAITLFGIVQGSCLEYGHSCWGAHGKRSGNAELTSVDRRENNELENNSKEIDSQIAKKSNKFLLSILLDKTFMDQLDEAQDPSDIQFDGNEEGLLNKKKYKSELQKRRLPKISNPNRDYLIKPQIISDNDWVQIDTLKKYAGLLPLLKPNGDFYETKLYGLEKSGQMSSLGREDLDIN